MAELVYAEDLKSSVLRLAGSNPASGTKPNSTESGTYGVSTEVDRGVVGAEVTILVTLNSVRGPQSTAGCNYFRRGGVLIIGPRLTQPPGRGSSAAHRGQTTGIQRLFSEVLADSGWGVSGDFRWRESDLPSAGSAERLGRQLAKSVLVVAGESPRVVEAVMHGHLGDGCSIRIR